MGMLRDFVKEYLKKLGLPPFVVFSRSFTRRHGFKISYLHELIHIHGLEKEKPKNMVLILSN
jgi:hypothetical protein